MGYVYKITNTVNNKAYIGISIHEPEKRRIKDHLTGRGNRVIANAVKKYGKDAFTYEILEENVFDEFLPDLEVAYIANFNTVAPHGYNLTSGGEKNKKPSGQTLRKLSEAGKGRTLTAETRRKISEGNRGKKRTAEMRRRYSESQKGNRHALGRIVSAETRRKISEGNRGKKRTAEMRRKNSELNKGERNPHYGKPRPDQTRRKISEGLKGRKRSAEHCRNLSEANRGRIVSAETRRRLSEAGKGRIVSAETRRKISKNSGAKHPEARRKISEANKLPEYSSAHKFFLSLSSDMPLKDKRKLLRTTFPNVKRNTIESWVRRWS